MSAVIYVLRRGDRIKVGYTTDLRRRMAQLSHDTADVIATIPAPSKKLEAIAHKYLSRWRITNRGEWFWAEPDCLAAVQEMIDGALMPYAERVEAGLADRNRLIAQIAAHESWANTMDRSARTAPARKALAQKFLDLADGDPIRAEHLKKAHFQRLALKSAQVRAAKKQATS